MTEHQPLIARQLEHRERMREYLEFSYQRTASLMPVKDWSALTAEQHETLARDFCGEVYNIGASLMQGEESGNHGS